MNHVLIKIHRIFMMTKYLSFIEPAIQEFAVIFAVTLQKLYTFFSFTNAQVKLTQQCHLFLY